MRLKTMICATALTLPIGVAGAQIASAQDVQDAISDSVADRLSPGNGTVPATQNGLGNSIGDAVRSGIGTAGNQVLQGNSVRGAIREGANQAIRQGAGQVTQQIAPNAMLGETLYRDSSGRLFRQDNYGNRYYLRSMSSTNSNTSSNFAANQRLRLGVGLNDSDQGLQITQVANGSAAAQAGLQPGDVVVSANGNEITSSSQLADMVRNADPNSQLDMTVMRDGQKQNLTATLAAKQGNRYSASKPAMNGSGGLESRIQSLEQEVQQLRSTINQMKGDSDTNAQSASMNETAGEEARAMNEESETSRNASARAEANEAAEATVEDAIDGSSAEARGNLDTEASVDNSGLELDGSANTETSLDNPLQN